MTALGNTKGPAQHQDEAAPQLEASGAEAGQTVTTFGALAGAMDAGLSLLRNEASLMKAEASKAAGTAGSAAASGAVALVLAMVGLNVLAGAAVAGLTLLGLSPFLSALVVGGVLLLLALGFVQSARGRLRQVSDFPKRASDNVKRDLDTLQSALRSKPDEQS